MDALSSRLHALNLMNPPLIDIPYELYGQVYAFLSPGTCREDNAVAKVLMVSDPIFLDRAMAYDIYLRWFGFDKPRSDWTVSEFESIFRSQGYDNFYFMDEKLGCNSVLLKCIVAHGATRLFERVRPKDIAWSRELTLALLEIACAAGYIQLPLSILRISSLEPKHFGDVALLAGKYFRRDLMEFVGISTSYSNNIYWVFTGLCLRNASEQEVHEACELMIPRSGDPEQYHLWISEFLHCATQCITVFLALVARGATLSKGSYELFIAGGSFSVDILFEIDLHLCHETPAVHPLCLAPGEVSASINRCTRLLEHEWVRPQGYVSALGMPISNQEARKTFLGKILMYIMLERSSKWSDKRKRFLKQYSSEIRDVVHLAQHELCVISSTSQKAHEIVSSFLAKFNKL